MADTAQLVPIRDDAPTPMNVLQMAISNGASIENLTRLLELQERWEANEARKAFYAAMQQFKSNPPKITKRGTGHNNTSYATLNDACSEIVPALAAAGISHKWDTKISDGKITVRCILSHESGYSDPNPPTIEAAADTSGSKNAIQAIGSTIKYLERYTLFAAVGLDDGTADDDGKGHMEKSKVEAALLLINESRSHEELKDRYLNAAGEAAKTGDKRALKELAAAKDARWNALKGVRNA